MYYLPLLLPLVTIFTETTHAQSIVAKVSPQRDFTVPSTFSENVTFDCFVTPGPNTRPAWWVDGFQLINPNDDLAQVFAATSIHIELITSNTTRLIITPEGRMTRLSAQGGFNDTIQCECGGFMIMDGAEVQAQRVLVSVTTYGPPAPPPNVNIISMAGGLSLVWDRPLNAFQGVSTNYTVSILNVTEANDRVLFQTTSTVETSFSIHFLEEELMGQPCREFQFQVMAQNDAGPGVPAVYNETVPISANTSEIDATLAVVSLELGAGNNVSSTLQFRTVNSCSENFPVLEYTININGQPALVINATLFPPLTITNFTVNSTNSLVPLFHNRFLGLTVTVRSAVSQRTSRPALLQTTDVQSAQVIFHQNNILLRCVFADITESRGCLFRFSPNTNGTGQQEFFLARDSSEMVLTQCNITMNQRSAYVDGRISVFDVESSGNVSSFSIRPMDSEIEALVNFTTATGCEIDTGLVLPPSQPINVAAVVAPTVILGLLALAAAIVIVIVITLYYQKKHNKHQVELQTHRDEADSAKRELETERTRNQGRKPSMTSTTDGVYSVLIDTGNLLDETKYSVSPSTSAHQNVSGEATPTTPPTTPPAESQGGPPPLLHLQPPTLESTGSTGSYSPERTRARPQVRRSYSEGAEPLLSSTSDILSGSGSVIQLMLRKGSMELKVRQEKLMEELRNLKAKKRMKLRSLSTDSSAHKESTPLLMTLSEIQLQCSPDLFLDTITENSLEELNELAFQETFEETGNSVRFNVGAGPGWDEENPPVVKVIEGVTGQQDETTL